MKKLYCTGGTGTIGKHLPKQVKRLKVDLSSAEWEFKSLSFDAQSNLIHLAGVVGVQNVLQDLSYARAVNVDGTKLIAQQFKEKSEGVFYFVSSSHVYAPSLNLISEESPLAPINIYAEQKLEAEYELLHLFESAPKRLCIIRIFSVLDWDVRNHTLGGAIKKLTIPDAEFILSNCSDIRDFLTPKTIAGALFEIASTDHQLGIVNLCSSQGISVGNAAKKMLTENAFEIAEHMFSWASGENPHIIGNNAWLLENIPSLDLNWKPSILYRRNQVDSLN